ncbi:MAG: hypothetical protein ACK56F_26225, partial [bacterium]
HEGPNASNVQGQRGGRSEGGVVAGDVVRRLVTITDAHALSSRVRTGAAKKISRRIKEIRVDGRSNSICAGHRRHKWPDNGRFHDTVVVL